MTANIHEDRLRIGVVAAGRGRIGMTLCPGKKQIGAASGDWNRDLDEDLKEIVKSIAGQIYGAFRGLAGLPNRWIRRIDVLVPLSRLAGELISSEPKRI